MIIKIFYWFQCRGVIQKLYPVSTDKELIRFGPKEDGGYLIPNDLDGISACFSPGVSSISGFEKDCADCGIKVYLSDASVDAPAESHQLFEFSKTFIGGGYARENFITLEQWIAQSSEDNSDELMMQMDIEGFEYEVLDHVSVELLKRFRIIVIEFHELEKFSKGKARVFKKLLKTHSCLHIHPNNCCGVVKLLNLEVPRIMEFTFLKEKTGLKISHIVMISHTSLILIIPQIHRFHFQLVGIAKNEQWANKAWCRTAISLRSPLPQGELGR